MSSAPSGKTVGVNTRKRKVLADLSQQPSQSYPKYRRSDTIFTGRNVENRCSICNERKSSAEDNKSNLLTCVSTSVASKKSVSSQNYKSFAAKYNISLPTVKKYFLILTSKPRVPIIRTEPSSKKSSPERFSQIPKLSPVFESRKGKPKPRINRKPKQIKQKSVPEKEYINVSQNLQNNFQTVEDIKIKEEQNFDFASEKPSQSKTISFTKNHWEMLIDSSGDEFEVSSMLIDNLCQEEGQVSTRKGENTSKKCEKVLVQAPSNKISSAQTSKIKNKMRVQELGETTYVTFDNGDKEDFRFYCFQMLCAVFFFYFYLNYFLNFNYQNY